MTMRDSISAARQSGPEAQTDGTTLFEFRFGADDPVFAGHFPGRPLLPGVFQLEMARAAAEWTLGCHLAVSEISRAKFQRPILPGEVVRLRLKTSGGDGIIQVTAAFSAGGQPAGETRLQLCRIG
jgi:3-hydroxyacyl-[acyl-carrier-protein] dehydratase